MAKLDSDKLRASIFSRRWVMKNLHRVTDLSYAHCWRLVYGKNTNPTLSTLGKLAEALNVDARELIITEENHG